MRSVSTRSAGLLIVVLGIWGGLIPFVGPYFHFVLGPTKSWTWTSGRLYLNVLPGIVAVVGGLMLLSSGPRPSARLGALVAIAAGIWFAIGPDVSYLWNAAGARGTAHGSSGIRTLELVTFHTGLGALIAALGGYAFPRVAVVGEIVAQPEVSEIVAQPEATSAATGARSRSRLPSEPHPVVAGDARPAGRDKPPTRDELATSAAPATEQRPYVAEPRAATDLRDDPAAGPTSAPVADRTREFAGAGPTGGPADQYADSAHVARRRRGGLLASLRSGR